MDKISDKADPASWASFQNDFQWGVLAPYFAKFAYQTSALQSKKIWPSTYNLMYCASGCFSWDTWHECDFSTGEWERAGRINCARLLMPWVHTTTIKQGMASASTQQAELSGLQTNINVVWDGIKSTGFVSDYFLDQMNTLIVNAGAAASAERSNQVRFFFTHIQFFPKMSWVNITVNRMKNVWTSCC